MKSNKKKRKLRKRVADNLEKYVIRVRGDKPKVEEDVYDRYD